MKELASYLVYAVRSLRKSPGFALSALAIFTLGIGANTAIFGIVNAVLLRPLPFPDSEAIVTIFHVPPPESFPGLRVFAVSPANFLDWRTQSTVFQSMALIGGRTFRMGGGSRPESVSATRTEPEFFKVLQVQPEIGRAFTSDECQPGRDDVVVLSHGFAQSHFGSARAAVGRSIELDGRSRKIIGVMPQSVQLRSWYPASTDVWVPIPWTKEEAAVRRNHNYLVVARLREGVSLAQARSEMNVISERLAREYPEDNKGWGAVVSPLREDLVGDVRPALLTLLGAVGFVLLIACANTANLVLARTITRRKELAIRAALGASAAQVFLPVLVETTLLSLAGGALGLLFARSAQALVMRALAEQMPAAVDIAIDGRVLAFTVVASVLTGLAAGMIACWRLMRIDPNESLKQGLGKTDAVSGGKRTRTALVVSEVAMSLVLLIGAGLMVRSLSALRGVHPGFVSSDVMTMTVPIPQASSGKGQRNRFYDELLPQVRRLPGVVSVAAIDVLPLVGGGSQQPIVVQGRPAEVFALQPNVAFRRATPDYFRTMRIPILAGRDFVEADTSEKKPVAIISESLARQFWPGENPLGKRLHSSFNPDVNMEVVGISGDVKERGLEVSEPIAMLYKPMPQNDRGEVSLVVRTAAGGGSTIVPAITRVLHGIDPELPVRQVAAMDEVVATSLSQERFSMFLFVALAGLAFLLAAVGIYSVLAYNVRTRVQEISIRMALGAQIPDVLRLIVFEGMRPAVIGIVVGIVGASMLSGILSRLVYGVSATDPATFTAVVVMLAAVAFLACLIPAYRATRFEPVRALRNE